MAALGSQIFYSSIRCLKRNMTTKKTSTPQAGADNGSVPSSENWSLHPGVALRRKRGLSAKEQQDRAKRPIVLTSKGTYMPPADTWEVPISKGGTVHKASFSEELVRIPILATTPPRGIVLDPFAGSGTSLRFAKRNGFRSIGIDLKEEYCEVMKASNSQAARITARKLMALYLSPETVKAATQHLIDSRARDGLVHFLLLKRALIRANANDVAFSSNDEHFTGAMRDLAGTYPPETGLVAPVGVSPFVKVFGTAGADKYVSGRWTTNGPADALSGPRWSSVVQITGNRPRRGSFKPDYQIHLPGLLLKVGRQMPSLTDAAIWYHRAVDLEARFGTVADSAQLDQRLQESFIEELGLTEDEVAALFDRGAWPWNDQHLAAVLRNAVANPQEYLPDLSRSDGELEEMLAEFEALANGAAVGLHLSHDLLLRFTAALSAKRFLILSGLAGSGKTKLAQAFARWLTLAPEEGQLAAYALIPVGADWTGNDNILGYPDGLDATKYVTRPALDLIQRAAQPENSGYPHFLILDEMNLSHVERYFADLLSLIESGETTELYRPGVNVDGETQFRADVEPILRLPPNLFIIGTVNVDETTYMFSPKVLDRANVIEFRMARGELAAFLASHARPRWTS